MTIIIFILILGALVFVHELGHFLMAKAFGIRVDEFALGFPPRLFKWKPKNSETTYSLNLLPLGGYVKIFGENPDEASLKGPEKKRSLVSKPKYAQVLVLIAGIASNIVFAWLLISGGFMIGLPVSVGDRYADAVRDQEVVVREVAPGSPAAAAGFLPEDVLVYLEVNPEVPGNVVGIDGHTPKEILRGSGVTPTSVRRMIAQHPDEPISVLVKRLGQTQTSTGNAFLEVTPHTSADQGRAAIGIVMDEVGVLKLPWHRALWEGLFFTKDIVVVTAQQIVHFLGQVFTGQADMDQVSGPVGIASQVGEARTLGFAYVLSFTAFISINLALLNLVPFPALDGGRILFVCIEAIIRRPIKPIIANWLNGLGFVLLILLMIVIAYNDIVKLVVG
ncbi:MAG: site-2 protease family protein [Patescibacteria group bacterium]